MSKNRSPRNANRGGSRRPNTAKADRNSHKPDKPVRSGHDRRNHKAVSRSSGENSLYLFGQHPVLAALLNEDRKKHRLLATENGLNRLPQEAFQKITVELVETSQLDALVGRDSVHQGLVLDCNPLDSLDASELFHLSDASLVLVLDQITDPHNVGAILRSAVAFNADAVLLTHRNSAVETGILAKSASGALDMVRTINVRNLSKAVNELNDMGFVTVGLDSEGPLILEETLAQANSRQIGLVLGSEGKGLRQQTRESCSYLARLDMPGKIKSLNVSNATALSLYVARANLTVD